VVLDKLQQFLGKIFVSVVFEIFQIVARDVTLRTNVHHQRGDQRVHVDVKSGQVPKTNHLVEISDFVERRHLVVVRVPRRKRQSVVFHSTVEDRKDCPKRDGRKNRDPIHEINHFPHLQQGLDHHHLRFVLRLKLFVFKLRYQVFQRLALADEKDHFAGCQPFHEDCEDYGGQGLQVLVGVDDVRRQKEIVTVDEDDHEDHVQCVLVEFVQSCLRPQSCHFQEQNVGAYRRFPVEFFHFNLDKMGCFWSAPSTFTQILEVIFSFVVEWKSRWQFLQKKQKTFHFITLM
jgi:hypothetical protein